jgi:hypothetical protein
MPARAGKAVDHRSEIVTAAGAVTTMVALGVVFALARDGTNVMGWYANYVIPAGALLVGAGAASGYGIAAWFTGLKMTRRLIWSVIGQLLLSYFIAQYEEYRHMMPGGEMGFWAWFDAMTRAFSFANHDGTPGSPFGVLGYAMRALEIGGFVLGGFAVPAALRSKPYCDACRTYRRTKEIAVIRGGLPGDSGSEGIAAVYAAAAATDRTALEKAIAEHGPLSDRRNAIRVSSRIHVWAVRCPQCAAGYISAARVEGFKNQVRRYALRPLPLEGDAMRTLFGEPSAHLR